MRVQGLAGDIKLPAAGVESYSFGTNGTLTAEMSDGTTTACGQVELENFTSPTQLMKIGNNLYSNLTAAGPQAAAAPGSSGLGSLVVGSLEMSNVDLAGQLTDLITTQRGYEANAKVITASDQILQDMVNLGR
jgi:flagellar hook protein FlgE